MIFSSDLLNTNNCFYFGEKFANSNGKKYEKFAKKKYKTDKIYKKKKRKEKCYLKK